MSGRDLWFLTSLISLLACCDLVAVVRRGRPQYGRRPDATDCRTATCYSAAATWDGSVRAARRPGRAYDAGELSDTFNTVIGPSRHSKQFLSTCPCKCVIPGSRSRDDWLAFLCSLVPYRSSACPGGTCRDRGLLCTIVSVQGMPGALPGHALTQQLDGTIISSPVPVQQGGHQPKQTLQGAACLAAQKHVETSKKPVSC